MQNNCIQYNFSHHPMTDTQQVPEQRLQNPEITNFTKFPKKFKLLDKRGFKLKEIRGADSFLLLPGNPHS